MEQTPDSLPAWLSRLEGLHPTTIDMGLDRVADVASRLSLPVFRKVITVSGTNGKGSCVAALEALARAHGLCVGSYTSPHLVRFNERIRVNGREASDENIVAAFRQVDAARQGVSLTYFEFGTLAALLCFAAADPDLVVLEVGLGGRLDAVNIVDADVAVITSIDLDHQQYLGDSRESVCAEKSGIRRPGKPLVCGDPEPPILLDQLCRESSTPLLLLGKDFDATPERLSVQSCETGRLGVAINNPMLLPSNLACALQAFVCAMGTCDASLASNTLSVTSLRGRRQRIHQCPDVFVDVGHNPHATRSLAAWWRHRTLKPHARRWAVVGMMSDKDIDGSLQPLIGIADQWVAVGLPPPRGLPGSSMAEILRSQGQPVASVYDSVPEALKFVLEHAAADDSVIIFGSFLMVSEIIGSHV